MSMVHDNVIHSYHVDFDRDQLLMKTQYQDGNIREKTDMIFSGYLTHAFQGARRGSVLFDISECEATRFCEAHLELFEARRNYCWPIAYQAADTLEELQRYLREHAYKAFVLASSFGLGGWVLAKEMEIIVEQA